MQFPWEGVFVSAYIMAGNAVVQGTGWLSLAVLGLSLWLIERYIMTRTQ